jgi:hypothetical protein
MNIYDTTERVEAMQHTQKAIIVLDSLTTKTPEIVELVKSLKEVRKELAYEVYRAK